MKDKQHQLGQGMKKIAEYRTNDGSEKNFWHDRKLKEKIIPSKSHCSFDHQYLPRFTNMGEDVRWDKHIAPFVFKNVIVYLMEQM